MIEPEFGTGPVPRDFYLWALAKDAVGLRAAALRQRDGDTEKKRKE